MSKPSEPTLPYAQKYGKIIRRIFPYYDELQELVSERVLGLCPEKIFLIGVGTGEEIVALRKTGYVNKIEGIEPNENMLKVASEILGLSRGDLDLFKNDWLHYDLKDKQYDLISCQLVLHFIEDDEKKLWLEKIKKALKPNGVLLISFLCGSFSDAESVSEWGAWRQLVLEKASEDLYDMIDKDFDLIKMSAHMMTIENVLQMFRACGFSGVKLIMQKHWLHCFQVQVNGVS